MTPTQERFQLALHPCKPHHPWRLTTLELHQQVDVALEAEVPA